MLAPQEKRLLLLVAAWLAAGSILDALSLSRPAAVVPLVGEGRFADLRAAGEAEPVLQAAAPSPSSAADTARAAAPGGRAGEGGQGATGRRRGRARVYDARGRLDLNLADASELDLIEGIGPALAGRILAERTRRGGFRRPQDLLEVRGIGPRTLAKLLPHITVAAPADSPAGPPEAEQSPKEAGRKAR